MFTFHQKGDFEKTINWLENSYKLDKIERIMKRYADKGVLALSEATPIDTELTANMWDYEISKSPTSATITFKNSNVKDGVPIVILLQYGHATRNGGYVQGRDFINPAIRPIFDRIAEEAWKEVLKVE